jgi:hypothetical protein
MVQKLWITKGGLYPVQQPSLRKKKEKQIVKKKAILKHPHLYYP